MTMDMCNGLFEFIGAVMVAINCWQVIRDRGYAGMSLVGVVFFTSWGFFNVFYYPHLSQWWSFVGGLFVSLANSTWIILMLIYGRHKRPCS